MRRTCEAILQGDILTAMNDLTPEAYADAMNLATGVTSVPAIESYLIESHESAGAEQIFRVSFKTSLRDLRARATWRQVEGAWKITGIAVDPSA